MDQSLGSFPSCGTSDRLDSTGVNRSVGCSGIRDRQEVSLVVSFGARTTVQRIPDSGAFFLQHSKMGTFKLI